MNSYAYLRGIVKIRPELVEVLRPRFTVQEGSDVVGDVAPMKLWGELDLPTSLKCTVAYQKLKEFDKGDDTIVPSVLYSIDDLPKDFEWFYFDDQLHPSDISLSYTDEGFLSFFIFNNNKDRCQEHLVALLTMMSDQYLIEQNWQNKAIRRTNKPDERITAWVYEGVHRRCINASTNWNLMHISYT